RAVAQPRLHARAEDRMCIGRIGADHDDDVGLVDGVEILRAGRGAEGLVQAIARGRMAHARASVGVVVAEARAGQLLDEKALLIRAARGGDDADRILAVFGLDLLEAPRRKGDGLLPGDDAPGLRDLVADHRLEDAIVMMRIAIGEAALDAAVAVIGLAVFPGNHAHDFLAAHLRLEGAAYAAIGAGRHGRMLRLARGDDRLLDERRGGAGLHAGAAGDAFGLHEGFRHAGRDAALEAAAGDRQRECALHLLACAHAAIAYDAFRWIVAEVGVRLVLRQPFEVRFALVAREDVIGAVVAVADVAQTDRAGHVLQ